MNRAKRILAGMAALILAAGIWWPCVHLIFARPVSAFCVKEGLSSRARELAERHMQLWTDPQLRKQELDRMRASNAEWDFMGRSYLVWALANLGLRETASKPACLETMDRIIDETLQLERQKSIYFFLMPYAKDRPYVVQPARSLFIDGEIAMMLASRCVLEDKPEYESNLSQRVNLIVAGLSRSPDMALESYPNECWTFDHVVALAAIRVADYLNGGDHSVLIRDWIVMAKRKLLHPTSGLLVSSFTTDVSTIIGPEGSSLWMVAHCLQLLDADFARDQYDRARRELGGNTLGFSYAREWPDSWKGPADIDSGPVIPFLDISAGSSGMAFIGASAFEDKPFLASLNATIDFAGFPSRKNGALKYCASNQVGDAALLYAATLGPIWEKVKEGRKPRT
jgi:hypothetical protein